MLFEIAGVPKAQINEALRGNIWNAVTNTALRQIFTLPLKFTTELNKLTELLDPNWARTAKIVGNQGIRNAIRLKAKDFGDSARTVAQAEDYQDIIFSRYEIEQHKKSIKELVIKIQRTTQSQAYPLENNTADSTQSIEALKQELSKKQNILQQIEDNDRDITFLGHYIDPKQKMNVPTEVAVMISSRITGIVVDILVRNLAAVGLSAINLHPFLAAISLVTRPMIEGVMTVIQNQMDQPNMALLMLQKYKTIKNSTLNKEQKEEKIQQLTRWLCGHYQTKEQANFHRTNENVLQPKLIEIQKSMRILAFEAEKYAALSQANSDDEVFVIKKKYEQLEKINYLTSTWSRKYFWAAYPIISDWAKEFLEDPNVVNLQFIHKNSGHFFLVLATLKYTNRWQEDKKIVQEEIERYEDELKSIKEEKTHQSLEMLQKNLEKSKTALAKHEAFEQLIKEVEEIYLKKTGQNLWEELKNLMGRKIQEYKALRWRKTNDEDHQNFKIFEAARKVLEIIEKKKQVDAIDAQLKDTANLAEGRYKKYGRTYSVLQKEKYQNELQKIQNELQAKKDFYQKAQKQVDFYLNYLDEAIDLQDPDNIVVRAILTEDKGRIRYIKNKFPRLYTYIKQSLTERSKDTHLERTKLIKTTDLLSLGLTATEVGAFWGYAKAHQQKEVTDPFQDFKEAVEANIFKSKGSDVLDNLAEEEDEEVAAEETTKTTLLSAKTQSSAKNDYNLLSALDTSHLQQTILDEGFEELWERAMARILLKRFACPVNMEVLKDKNKFREILKNTSLTKEEFASLREKIKPMRKNFVAAHAKAKANVGKVLKTGFKTTGGLAKGVGMGVMMSFIMEAAAELALLPLQSLRKTVHDKAVQEALQALGKKLQDIKKDFFIEKGYKGNSLYELEKHFLETGAKDSQKFNALVYELREKIANVGLHWMMEKSVQDQMQHDANLRIRFIFYGLQTLRDYALLFSLPFMPIKGVAGTSGYLSGQFGSSLMLNPSTWVNQYSTLQLPVQRKDTRSFGEKARDILPIFSQNHTYKELQQDQQAGVPYLFDDTSFQATVESSKNFSFDATQAESIFSFIGDLDFQKYDTQQIGTVTQVNQATDISLSNIDHLEQRELEQNIQAVMAQKRVEYIQANKDYQKIAAEWKQVNKKHNENTLALLKTMYFFPDTAKDKDMPQELTQYHIFNPKQNEWANTTIDEEHKKTQSNPNSRYNNVNKHEENIFHKRHYHYGSWKSQELSNYTKSKAELAAVEKKLTQKAEELAKQYENQPQETTKDVSESSSAFIAERYAQYALLKDSIQQGVNNLLQRIENKEDFQALEHSIYREFLVEVFKSPLLKKTQEETLMDSTRREILLHEVIKITSALYHYAQKKLGKPISPYPFSLYFDHWFKPEVGAEIFDEEVALPQNWKEEHLKKHHAAAQQQKDELAKEKNKLFISPPNAEEIKEHLTTVYWYQGQKYEKLEDLQKAIAQKLGKRDNKKYQIDKDALIENFDFAKDHFYYTTESTYTTTQVIAHEHSVSGYANKIELKTIPALGKVEQKSVYKTKQSCIFQHPKFVPKALFESVVKPVDADTLKSIKKRNLTEHSVVEQKRKAELNSGGNVISIGEPKQDLKVIYLYKGQTYDSFEVLKNKIATTLRSRIIHADPAQNSKNFNFNGDDKYTVKIICTAQRELHKKQNISRMTTYKKLLTLEHQTVDTKEQTIHLEPIHKLLDDRANKPYLFPMPDEVTALALDNKPSAPLINQLHPVKTGGASINEVLPSMPKAPQKAMDKKGLYPKNIVKTIEYFEKKDPKLVEQVERILDSKSHNLTQEMLNLKQKFENFKKNINLENAETALEFNRLLWFLITQLYTLDFKRCIEIMKFVGLPILDEKNQVVEEAVDFFAGKKKTVSKHLKLKNVNDTLRLSASQLEEKNLNRWADQTLPTEFGQISDHLYATDFTKKLLHAAKKNDEASEQTLADFANYYFTHDGKVNLRMLPIYRNVLNILLKNNGFEKNKIAIARLLTPVLQQKNIVIRDENNHYDWEKIEKILHLNKYNFQANANQSSHRLNVNFINTEIEIEKILTKNLPKSSIEQAKRERMDYLTPPAAVIPHLDKFSEQEKIKGLPYLSKLNQLLENWEKNTEKIFKNYSISRFSIGDLEETAKTFQAQLGKYLYILTQNWMKGNVSSAAVKSALEDWEKQSKSLLTWLEKECGPNFSKPEQLSEDQKQLQELQQSFVLVADPKTSFMGYIQHSLKTKHEKLLGLTVSDRPEVLEAQVESLKIKTLSDLSDSIKTLLTENLTEFNLQDLFSQADLNLSSEEFAVLVLSKKEEIFKKLSSENKRIKRGLTDLNDSAKDVAEDKKLLTQQISNFGKLFKDQEIPEIQWVDTKQNLKIPVGDSIAEIHLMNKEIKFFHYTGTNENELQLLNFLLKNKRNIKTTKIYTKRQYLTKIDPKNTEALIKVQDANFRSNGHRLAAMLHNFKPYYEIDLDDLLRVKKQTLTLEERQAWAKTLEKQELKTSDPHYQKFKNLIVFYRDVLSEHQSKLDGKIKSFVNTLKDNPKDEVLKEKIDILNHQFEKVQRQLAELERTKFIDGNSVTKIIEIEKKSISAEDYSNIINSTNNANLILVENPEEAITFTSNNEINNLYVPYDDPLKDTSFAAFQMNVLEIENFTQKNRVELKNLMDGLHEDFPAWFQPHLFERFIKVYKDVANNKIPTNIDDDVRLLSGLIAEGIEDTELPIDNNLYYAQGILNKISGTTYPLSLDHDTIAIINPRIKKYLSNLPKIENMYKKFGSQTLDIGDLNDIVIKIGGFKTRYLQNQKKINFFEVRRLLFDVKRTNDEKKKIIISNYNQLVLETVTKNIIAQSVDYFATPNAKEVIMEFYKKTDEDDDYTIEKAIQLSRDPNEKNILTKLKTLMDIAIYLDTDKSWKEKKLSSNDEIIQYIRNTEPNPNHFVHKDEYKEAIKIVLNFKPQTKLKDFSENLTKNIIKDPDNPFNIPAKSFYTENLENFIVYKKLSTPDHSIYSYKLRTDQPSRIIENYEDNISIPKITYLQGSEKVQIFTDEPKIFLNFTNIWDHITTGNIIDLNIYNQTLSLATRRSAKNTANPNNNTTLISLNYQTTTDLKKKIDRELKIAIEDHSKNNPNFDNLSIIVLAHGNDGNAEFIFSDPDRNGRSLVIYSTPPNPNVNFYTRTDIIELIDQIHNNLPKEKKIKDLKLFFAGCHQSSPSSEITDYINPDFLKTTNSFVNQAIRNLQEYVTKNPNKFENIENFVMIGNQSLSSKNLLSDSPFVKEYYTNYPNRLNPTSRLLGYTLNRDTLKIDTLVVDHGSKEEAQERWRTQLQAQSSLQLDTPMDVDETPINISKSELLPTSTPMQLESQNIHQNIGKNDRNKDISLHQGCKN